jgi:hypothetical protein
MVTLQEAGTEEGGWWWHSSCRRRDGPPGEVLPAPAVALPSLTICDLESYRHPLESMREGEVVISQGREEEGREHNLLLIFI